MYVYAGPEAIAKTVTLSDLYLYDNDLNGANIYNLGTITLTNVRANSNNGGYGMLLDNRSCGTTTPCKVSILQSGSGVNEFNLNDGSGGLRIDTYGIVVMNKVNAVSNEGYGAWIDNDAATTPVNVTITGGKFNSNESGLRVVSKGVITVSGIQASSNTLGDYGAYLDNRADTSGNKGINVLKSFFNNNAVTGLGVRTYGAVVLNTNEASGNITGMGVDVNNDYSKAKPVSILSTYGANNFNSNSGHNLQIYSNGAVVLSKVTADDSTNGTGIRIFNYSGSGTVSLTTITTRYNSETGLLVDTSANVTINGLTNMFNCAEAGTWYALSISTNETITARVTISNSIITSNVDRGIGLNLAPAPNAFYTLTNVFYFGNDTDNSGDNNLYVY